MKLKSKLKGLVLGAALMLTVPMAPMVTVAHAADSTRASQNLSAASGIVVLGGMSVLAASGELIVTGVEQSARGVSVVVKRVTDASGDAATLLLDASAAASITVGSALQASATGVGFVLVASGRAIAFIPNEIGLSLIHQSRYSR